MQKHTWMCKLVVYVMSKDEFSRKLHKIVGKKLSQGLEKIIFESGFDSEYALTTLNPETIKTIEEFINENKNVLKGTVYESVIESNSVFKLKPGHKAAILSLPKALTDYEAKINKNFVSSTEEKLKQSLLKKITKFARKCSFEINFGVSSIFEFQQRNEVYKCRLKCPLCNILIRCEHKKYWLVSNFEKHLKNHFVRDIQSVDIDLHTEEVHETTSNPIHILSYVDSQMDALDNILRE